MEDIKTYKYRVFINSEKGTNHCNTSIRLLDNIDPCNTAIHLLDKVNIKGVSLPHPFFMRRRKGDQKLLNKSI